MSLLGNTRGRDARAESNVQNGQLLLAPCSTLRQISTCISIAVCVHLAVSPSTLRISHHRSTGEQHLVDRSCCGQKGSTARSRAVEPERQMCPCDACVHLSPRALNLGWVSTYNCISRSHAFPLHLHDSLPHPYLCSSFSQSHLPPQTSSIHKEINHFFAPHISSTSVHCLHVRPPILPVTIPSTTICLPCSVRQQN